MGGTTLTIREVTARAVLAPLERPIRTAVGTIPSAPLVLVDVGTAEGITGSAYLFAYTPVALAPLARLVEDIGKEICGRPVVPIERMRPTPARSVPAGHSRPPHPEAAEVPPPRRPAFPRRRRR